jgi:heat shock protein HtpX
MFKRIALFVAVNIAIMMTISLILNLIGFQGYHTQSGNLDYSSLMVFCLVWGMVGAFISLLMSKWMAKRMFGLQVLDSQSGSMAEQRLVAHVHRMARSAGLSKNPEVAIYDSPELNAFATGPSRNNSLVAVSTGLLRGMSEDEVEGVLAHEVSHIANGDMVTMTLIQGVINAFVMFFAKIAAWTVANAMRGDDEEGAPSMWLVFAIEMVFYMIFGLIGGMITAWFSRYREYRADAGGAQLAGREKMIAALKRLKNHVSEVVDNRGEAIAALKISNKRKSFMDFLATHPPLESRIQYLEQGLRD